MIIESEKLRNWLQDKVKTELASDARFIGRIVDGNVVWVVGFSHYVGNDIELTVAVEKGVTRKSLKAVFGYVFDTAHCSRCTVKTRASNARAIELARRLGFVHEGTLRQGFGDEDTMIYGLLRNEYGKQHQ